MVWQLITEGQKGSLLCHTSCYTRPLFLRSHPRDAPPPHPLSTGSHLFTTSQGYIWPIPALIPYDTAIVQEANAWDLLTMPLNAEKFSMHKKIQITKYKNVFSACLFILQVNSYWLYAYLYWSTYMHIATSSWTWGSKGEGQVIHIVLDWGFMFS